MIRRSIIGISPILSMTIGDAAVDYNSINNVIIDLKVGSHDLCEITMVGIPAPYVTEYLGKSVYVKMDNGPSYVTEFHGTIEKASPTANTADGTVNRSLLQEVVFVCLGVSYRMIGTTSMVWSGYSLEEVARKFCKTYELSLDVPNDPVVFGNLTQSNESDWQFISRYADIMGYCVTVHGTHMHIFDPHKAVGRNISFHNINTITRTGTEPHPGQITSFDGRFARLTMDGTVIDATTTVHTDSGKVFDVNTSDIAKLDKAGEIITSLSTAVSTYDQAERLLNATRRDEYDYCAEVTTIGLLGVLPGGVVNLDRYDGMFDGLWYVDGVRHYLRTGMFVTTLTLYKNKVDTLVDKSLSPFTVPPAPKFVTDKWVSSLRTVNVYN